MSMKVVKPGLLTTVQDTGRTGYQKYGVLGSGAMDTISLRIANLLAGNQEKEAGLEITLMGPGPSFEFSEPAVIAVTGADFALHINGSPPSMETGFDKGKQRRLIRAVQDGEPRLSRRRGDLTCPPSWKAKARMSERGSAVLRKSGAKDDGAARPYDAMFGINRVPSERFFRTAWFLSA